MKENQMDVLIHSNNYEKGSDLLSFSPSELSSENDHKTNLDTLTHGLTIVDDFWTTGGVAKNSELIEKHPKNGTENGYEICTSSKPMALVILDEFNPRNEEKNIESETPSSSISELLEPDVYMYTDKNIVECEMPDLDVPSNVHIVKDICVDTRAVQQEITWIESNKDGLVCESINGDQSSLVKNTEKKSSNNCESWETFESMNLDEENISSSNSIADNVSEEASSISSTRVSGEFLMQESLLNSLKQEEEEEEDEVTQNCDEVPSMDTILESLAVMFNSKDSKKEEDQMSKLAYNSKVEGGTITFDFKSSNPDVLNCGKEDTNETLSNGKSMAEAEDEKSKDQSTSNVEINTATKKEVYSGIPPQVQSVNGESSFSMMEPVSGLISYSGQIAYAGSTSIRSDSSTTSTRSFAFPVLQSEWNSSPVRMHKAVPRRRRNHWHGYLCCRF